MSRFGCIITVANGQAPSSQSDVVWTAETSNFPAASIDGSTNSILNGGGNLRCYTDDTKAVQLPVHIEKFVTGGSPQVIIWGKSPSLDVASTVYIEADTAATSQPAVGSTYGSQAVYSGDLYRSHDGGVTEVSNGYTVADDGSGSVAIGNRPGTDALTAPRKRLIDVTAADTVGDHTLTVWSNGLGPGTLLCRRDDGDTQYQIGLSGGDNFYQYDGGSELSTSQPSGWAKSQWVITSGSAQLFINGVISGTAASITQTSKPTVPLRLGMRGSGGLGTVAFEYGGVIGETSVSNSAQTAHLIETEYNNQSNPSAFWNTGAWENQEIDINSTISFDIAAPTFAVTAEPVAIPGNDADISFSIAEPTFNVHAGTDQDIYYYGRGTQLKLIIKSRELRI